MEPIVQIGLAGVVVLVSMTTTIILDGFLSICCKTDKTVQLQNTVDSLEDKITQLQNTVDKLENNLEVIEKLIYAPESSDGEYNLK